MGFTILMMVVTTLLIAFGILGGKEFFRSKFEKIAKDSVLCEFICAGGKIKRDVHPVEKWWVLAPKKFGQLGNAHYFVHDQACFDDVFGNLLVKVPIKKVYYREGRVVPDRWRDGVVSVEVEGEEGKERLVVKTKERGAVATLPREVDDPYYNADYVGAVVEEKTAQVAMEASQHIADLQQKLTKLPNAMYLYALGLVSALCSLFAAYGVWKIMNDMEALIRIVSAGLGVAK